jgi:WD40 repeat protein
VTRLLWLPDGRTLAVGGEDESIRLWDSKTSKAIGLLGKARVDPQKRGWLPSLSTWSW